MNKCNKIALGMSNIVQTVKASSYVEDKVYASR